MKIITATVSPIKIYLKDGCGIIELRHLAEPIITTNNGLSFIRDVPSIVFDHCETVDQFVYYMGEARRALREVLEASLI